MGVQLASGASWQLGSDAANILAQRELAIDHQRHLVGACRQEGCSQLAPDVSRPLPPIRTRSLRSASLIGRFLTRLPQAYPGASAVFVDEPDGGRFKPRRTTESVSPGYDPFSN